MISDIHPANTHPANAPAANVHPDRQTCYGYLQEYGTPPHVIGHCKAVAAVGYALAKALNQRSRLIRQQIQTRRDRMAHGTGPNDPAERCLQRQLDLELILAAGLLHDMARVEEDHQEAAARFCESRGLKQEAEIIRVHMTYPTFNDLEHLNETDIVCLADRTVLEDRYAGLDRRMEYIIGKARRNGHPEYETHIRRKMGEVKVLIEEIETLLGESMDDLMQRLDYDCPESDSDNT